MASPLLKALLKTQNIRLYSGAYLEDFSDEELRERYRDAFSFNNVVIVTDTNYNVHYFDSVRELKTSVLKKDILEVISIPKDKWSRLGLDLNKF